MIKNLQKNFKEFKSEFGINNMKSINDIRKLSSMVRWEITLHGLKDHCLEDGIGNGGTKDEQIVLKRKFGYVNDRAKKQTATWVGK